MDVHEFVACPDFGCVEVGCTVYSKTHTMSSGYPVGGVVISVDDDHVYVLPNFAPSKGPDPRRIDEADINDDPLVVHDRFYTRDAGVAAKQIFAWLARQTSKKDSVEHDEWAATAVQLQLISRRTYTPRAERRYAEWQEARRMEESA